MGFDHQDPLKQAAGGGTAPTSGSPPLAARICRQEFLYFADTVSYAKFGFARKNRRGATGEVARGGDQRDLEVDPFEYLTPLSSANLKRSHSFHVYEAILVNR